MLRLFFFGCQQLYTDWFNIFITSKQWGWGGLGGLYILRDESVNCQALENGKTNKQTKHAVCDKDHSLYIPSRKRSWVQYFSAVQVTHETYWFSLT